MMKFNNGFQINVQIQDEIAEFINYKNFNDKNNFIISEEDQMLLEQLPDMCKKDLYTKFLFKDFLYKFKRLFRIPINQAIYTLVKSNGGAKIQNDFKDKYTYQNINATDSECA